MSEINGYEPYFIVETDNEIFMIDIKINSDFKSEHVI